MTACKFVRVASLLLVALFASRAVGQIDAEAVPGEPFGVGRISVRLPDGATAGLSGVDALEVTEANGRILYPARNAGLLGRAADAFDDPGRLSLMFIFRGTEPLDVTLYAPRKQTVRIVPGGRPRAHQRMLRQWWRQYNAAAEQMVSRGGYPALFDHYLLAMLSRRTGLEPTLQGRKLLPSGEPDSGLGLLLGTQSLHAAVLHDAMLGNRGLSSEATEPLPSATLPPIRVPDVPEDVRIEEIAKHVPEECYYVRFGSFANYRWMRDLLTDFGGDLGNMISAQGLDFDQSGRMETQLAIRDTTLGNLFGGQVISDVAMIGMDTFFREGAAVGMLFEARSNAVLSNDIAKHRTAAKDANADAKLSTIKIAGRDVSFLHTPDNRIRSFYAVDGDYHLVTSSEGLVHRFFEAGEGKASLGGSAEFRHARREMPTKRNDTIFAYLSDAFLRNLASPHYRVEMARRLRSAVEMDLLTLARLAAKAEGIAARSPRELADAGFLPADIAVRPDGSRIVFTDEGRPFDSLRGGRGSFLPVPDVPVQAVTAREADDYARFSDAFRATLGQAEPILIALRREAGDQLKFDDRRERPKPQGELETVSIEARVSPFTGRTYRTIAERLGPATREYVEPLDGNLVSLSAHVRNVDLRSAFAGMLGGLGEGPLGEVLGNLRGGAVRPEAPPPDERSRLMFVGLDDFAGPVAPGDGFLNKLQAVRQANLYVGSWPEAGPIARFLGLDRPLAEGEAAFFDVFPQLGVWGLKHKDFTVVALHKEDLAAKAGQLRVVEADRPAQIRVRAGDLTGTHLAAYLNALGYGRTWAGSTGNSRYLHRLAEQFHIPRSETLPLAENLCGAKLICPLGGEYKLAERDDGLTVWTSTAWEFAKSGQNSRSVQTPDGYVAPPLVWFRGLDAEAALEPGKLTVRAKLVVERKAKGGLGLPSILGN
ncbi:MAG: hypothetical protein DCC68_22970 [Planctomycetota bacterium]|nr:MAG: hypothetical protein DCC68_22970 [Planctomycetota bacterium]